jgi:hypothetical protein
VNTTIRGLPPGELPARPWQPDDALPGSQLADDADEVMAVGLAALLSELCDEEISALEMALPTLEDKAPPEATVADLDRLGYDARRCVAILWSRAAEVRTTLGDVYAAPPSRPSRFGDLKPAMVELRRWALSTCEGSQFRRATTRGEPQPTLKALGKRAYQLGAGKPFVLTPRESDVLEAFVRQPAMDERTLVKESGREDAASILRALRKKRVNGAVNYLRHVIHCPGRKSAEGYRVAIEEA